MAASVRVWRGYSLNTGIAVISLSILFVFSVYRSENQIPVFFLSTVQTLAEFKDSGPQQQQPLRGNVTMVTLGALYPPPRSAGKHVVLLLEPHLQGFLARAGNVSHCEARNCLFTTDRKFLPRADLVLVHLRDVMRERVTLPKRASPRQRRGFLINESPANVYKMAARGWKRARNHDREFDLSLTYESDSDIRIPYGAYRERRAGPASPGHARTLGNRTKLALWYVSNCRASHRLNYVSALRNHVQVDVYGRCGQEDTCDAGRAQYRSDCAKNRFKRYKFYLAFENSICKDYITEKFWKSLDAGMVPVVMGTSEDDYKRAAPPNSFIHVDSFKSPQILAEYLTYLDENDAAYYEYHAWRRNYELFNSPWYCEVCKYMASDLRSLGKHPGITNYWDPRKMCTAVEKHPILKQYHY